MNENAAWDRSADALWDRFVDALDECERLLELRNSSEEWDPDLDKELRTQYCQAGSALVEYNHWARGYGDCVVNATRDRFGELATIMEDELRLVGGKAGV